MILFQTLLSEVAEPKRAEFEGPHTARVFEPGASQTEGFPEFQVPETVPGLRQAKGDRGRPRRNSTTRVKLSCSTPRRAGGRLVQKPPDHGRCVACIQQPSRRKPAWRGLR